MAVLTAPTVVGQGGGQGQPRWVVLAFPKVSANDTYDISTLSGVASAFQTVFDAIFAATSNRTATFTVATFVGTVVTILGAGISGDTGLLVVIGE